MATECDFELPPGFPRSPAPEVPGSRREIDPPSDLPEPPAAELEFHAAIQEYRQISGRMFPTWSEVLEIARGLGYRKPDDPSTGR